MAQKVLLNVYDLSQGLARQLSTTLLGKAIEGIWHTGIVVFGYEYYFGGGIQSCLAGQTPYGIPVKVVELGYTEVPKEVFVEYLQEISPRYTVQTYSLLQHNCNNFSEEISQFLCGVGIPEVILKLPEEAMNSPIGALIMPMIQQFETTLRYGAVPQAPHASGIQGPPLSLIRQVSAIPVAPMIAFGTVSEGQTSAGTTPVSVAHRVSTPLVGSEKMADEREKHAESTGIPDKLGEARARVQEEITREFAALMAEGRLRASEAAALATRRVMERHGRGAGLSSQS